MSACVHVSVREREIKRARFQKCALPATVRISPSTHLPCSDSDMSAIS